MPDDELRGSNRMAAHCAETIPLIEARLAALTGAKAKEARRHLKMMRDIQRWCTTRAGYVKPERAASNDR